MSTAHILVVDDEDDIRNTISDILEDEGYDVSVASDAATARAEVGRERPDLILLDVWMPDVDGMVLLRRAHELGPQGTIDLVARSGLRGRGGGGFPTGRKWAGVADQEGGRRYLVCNGAEGEPGTFKVRVTHPTIALPARYNTATELGYETESGNPNVQFVLADK